MGNAKSKVSTDTETDSDVEDDQLQAGFPAQHTQPPADASGAAQANGLVHPQVKSEDSESEPEVSYHQTSLFVDADCSSRSQG